MFARVQSHDGKPIKIMNAHEAMTNGTPVTVNSDDELAKATGVADYIAVSAENFDGMNAVKEPNWAAFEDIEADKPCLRYPTEVGDIFATTELTATGLSAGDYLTASAGKFVKNAASGNVQYVYRGTFDNPWGKTMYLVERIALVAVTV